MKLPSAVRGRTDRGANAVEFALVVMPLLVVILAIIQFSTWFWSYQTAANAAREGARRYAVDPCRPDLNDALVRDRVAGAADGPISVSHSFVRSAPLLQAGDTVTVVVRYSTFDLTAGLLPLPTVISKSASARVEDVEDCG